MVLEELLRGGAAELTHGPNFFLDWRSCAYFWVLLPIGQRIALGLDQLVLLDELPAGLEQAMREAEEDWASQYLLSGADRYELKEALLPAVRYKLKSVAPVLLDVLRDYSSGFGGAIGRQLPGNCSVASLGPIPLLKLVLHYLGVNPPDCSGYNLHGAQLPKVPADLSLLHHGQSPREVLRVFGCPDWIDLGSGKVWDFYRPHPEAFAVQCTTIEWDQEAAMRSLTTVVIRGEEVLERANLMLVRTMIFPGEPLRILSIHP